MKKYSHSGKSLSVYEVRNAGRDVQCEVMNEWFFENFEDPSENTIMIGHSYIYTCGGPYDAYWVLGEEFENVIPEEVIISFVDDNLFGHNGFDWAPKSSGLYYHLEDEEIAQNPYLVFEEENRKITALLAVSISPNIPARELTLYKLLYVGVISSLDVYLSDNFLMRINENGNTLRQFIETYKGFQKEDIPTSIYDTTTNMKKFIQDKFRFNWHDLSKVESIYRKHLGIINFPKSRFIVRAIKERNAMIHKGKTELSNGEGITREHVKELIDEIEKFVRKIHEAQVKPPEQLESPDLPGL